MNILKKFCLNLRIARRLGAFKRARQEGMTIDEARIYSDKLYPPTAAEAEYEQELRRKHGYSN